MEAMLGGRRNPLAGVSPLPVQRQGSDSHGSAACDSVEFQGKGLLRIGGELVGAAPALLVIAAGWR